MTPFECYFYYFGILLEYRANFRHRNQKISLADTVNMLKTKIWYSGARVIASRILHEICLLISKLVIRGTKLTLNARLGTKRNLLIEQ